MSTLKTSSARLLWLMAIFTLVALAFMAHRPGSATANAPAAPLGGGSRTIRFPANALNYDMASPIISQVARGLEWDSSFEGSAYLNIPQPIGWSNNFTVTLNLYFAPTTNTAGNVDFFIRPRSYTPGDIFFDAPSLESTPVAVDQTNKIYRQTFNIEPTYFDNGPLWVIGIQREGSNETYPDPITLYSVELVYIPIASPPATGQVGLPANAINFDDNSSVITQRPVGLNWTATSADNAYLTIPRPRDWDGNSDVNFRVYFRATTNTTGLVDFFIRPRGYRDGDTFTDVSSVGSPGVQVNQQYQLQAQDIVIPADRFANKDLWMITIQRDGSDETYPDPIDVVAFELTYGKRALPFFEQTNLPAQALNFDKNSTVIEPTSLGLLWNQDFSNPAYIMVMAPNGWSFNNDMELHLFMMPNTDTAGEMAFFIRPRAYLPGDIFGDGISLETTAVPASGRYDIREQIFTIPANYFNSKNFWVITLQREATGDTYPDELILLAAELRPIHYQTNLPLLNRP